MNAFVLYATALGALLLGAVLTAVVGFPAVAHRVRAELAETLRVVEGVRLAREPLHPLVEEALPDESTPIGAEPVPAQVRDGVTGRAEGPRTSGNAAPPVKVEPPPHAGGPAGPKRQARAITALAYRKVQVLIALDRVAAPLRTSQGRHRVENIGLDLHGTIAQRRFSRAAEQREVHRAVLVSPSLRALDPGWRRDVEEIPVARIGELAGVAT
jgi:hypothetical protein